MSRVPSHYADQLVDNICENIRDMIFDVGSEMGLSLPNDLIDDDITTLVWELVGVVTSKIEETDAYNLESSQE